jgi:hypothetical protein
MRGRSWLYGRSRRTQLLFGAAFLTAPLWIGGGGAALYGLYLYYAVFTPEDRAYTRYPRLVYPHGLPSAARRLKAEMGPIPDPESALQRHPNWAAIRFNNGEWVFGYGISTHEFTLGHGTQVVKDSRGQVRIFFGHVCGENAPLEMCKSGLIRATSLDDFYSQLQDGPFEFREWVPDR